MTYTNKHRRGYIVNSFECGCRIESEFLGGMGAKVIEYCPQHKAAPEMYEALKMYQNFIRNTRSMGRTYSEVEILQAQTKIAQKLNEALAKAEGVN